MQKQRMLFILLLFSLYFKFSYPSNTMKLTRAIVASDNNDMFLPFWPLVAEAWTKIVGLRPTLILVAHENVIVDTTIGDVIRFKPIPGIPTGLQAQIIRLFMMTLYKNEACIISDIDMIPTTKNYYIDSVKYCPDNTFIAYRNNAYEQKRFPMCYIAAKGSTIQEIFNINSIDDMRQRIIEWYGQHLGYGTDELMMYKYVTQWKDYKQRCIQLGHCAINRLDRSNWQYDEQELRKGHYIDAHLLRPYKKYKKEIDKIANILGIDSFLKKIDQQEVDNTIKKFYLTPPLLTCMYNAFPSSNKNYFDSILSCPHKESDEKPCLRVKLITLYDDLFYNIKQTVKKLVNTAFPQLIEKLHS